MLTQERLKELLTYNPDTGKFVWKCTKHKHRKEAGHPNDKGYILIDIDKKKYRAHRLAWLYMKGHMPKDQVDHINHIKDDNRLVNLRLVDNKENHKNKCIPKNNTSGIMGVSWAKKRELWEVRIKNSGVYLHIGYFNDFFEAICSRKSAENKYKYHANHGQLQGV